MTTLEDAQTRMREAVNSEDEGYIEEFKLGLEASANSDTLDTNKQSQAFIDGYTVGEDQKSKPISNRLVFSPHPMGGIGVTLYGSDGNKAQARLEMDAASLASTHLNALLTMMIQTAYMLQAQAAEQANQSNIVIPGR